MAEGDTLTHHEDGEWRSKVEGSLRAAHAGGTKAEYEAVGHEMAIERNVEHIVENMDGKIGHRNSYGHNPFPPEG